MSLVVASQADSSRASLYMTFSSFGLGICLILLGLAPTFALAIGAMILVGGCSSAFQTLNNAVALRRTTQSYLGRVVSLMFLAWGMMSLASLPIGFLGDLAGERAVLAGLGVALCVIVLLLALWERRIMAADRAEAASSR
jgi:predicted MFS family arabinose efflux permease